MIEVFEVTLPELTGDEARRAYVYVPEEARRDARRRFPVLYMFDGHNVFFDEDATYGKSWGLGEYLDAHRVPLIVAAVECNHDPDNGRLSEYAPYTFTEPGFGTIVGHGPETMDWLIHSFKPLIDRRYPTKPDRKHTMIAGSSMGGLMSLYAVSVYNGVFSSAAALSPSEKEMGWRGMQREFRRFTGVLLKKRIRLTARVVPGGRHCEASWEKQIPFFLPTLLYGLED